MKLNINISTKMNDMNILGNEDNTIRMLDSLRIKLSLYLNSFIPIALKDGGIIYLKIKNLYKEDMGKGWSAFVTEYTYNRLLLTKDNIKGISDKLTIGCDPELFIVNKDTKKIISAGNFFSSNGDVGNDVGLLELRPAPTVNEDELANNIHSLMIKAKKHINNRKIFKRTSVGFIASSVWEKSAAGFHIHFGIPKDILNNNVKDEISEAIRHRIVSVLDYYVGIPAVIPEGNDDSMRRSHKYGAYGKAGDFRYNDITYEYRVPGGHLLRHPLLAKGILSIGRVVMSDLLMRIQDATNSFSDIKLLNNYNSIRSLYPNLPDRTDVCDAISSRTIDKPSVFINKIFEDIKNMHSFKDSSKNIYNYINYLHEHSINGENMSEDVETNWEV